jgi:hypothetical protein
VSFSASTQLGTHGLLTFSGGRTKAACCKLKDEQPVPARCTADLCSAIEGFCPDDEDDESANGRDELKRDLLHLFSSNITEVDAMDDELWSHLEKRAGPVTYKSVLASGVVIATVSAPYPSIGRLYKVANAAKVIKKSFKTIKGQCLSGAAAVAVENLINTGSSALATLQSEHPIDVSDQKHDQLIKLTFFTASNNCRFCQERC